MTLRPPYTPITAKLYRQLPEGPPYYELINGKLYMSPSVTFFHQTILGRLHLAIGKYLEKKPIGLVIFAPSDVFLDELNVCQPDLYFVREEHRSVIVKEGIQGAPDLVVEILSPTNSKRDRGEKRQVYADAGVAEMWIVDPKAHQVEVHPLRLGLDATPEIIRKPAAFRPAIFPGLAIDTAKLFQPV